MKEENNNKIIIYNTEDGQTKIDVRLDDETVCFPCFENKSVSLMSTGPGFP